MGVIEIIGGVLLLISSLFIIIVTLMQSQKQQGMTSAITGAENDSFYGKNSGNTREAALERLTNWSYLFRSYPACKLYSDH